MKEFKKRLQVWLEGAQKIIDEYSEKHLPNLWASGSTNKLKFVKGRKYIKIISVDPDRRSVFAFINMTNGDVLKAKSWRRPAAKARGNIFNSDNGLECVNPYGVSCLR